MYKVALQVGKQIDGWIFQMIITWVVIGCQKCFFTARYSLDLYRQICNCIKYFTVVIMNNACQSTTSSWRKKCIHIFYAILNINYQIIWNISYITIELFGEKNIVLLMIFTPPFISIIKVFKVKQQKSFNVRKILMGWRKI